MQQKIASAIMLSVFLIGLSVSVAHADISPCPHTWGQNLKFSSSGSDVLALQMFLNSNASTTIATFGAGSPGNETSHYGTLTAKAVSEFQMLYAVNILAPAGLSKPTGIVGTLTRSKLNALCSSSSIAGPTTAATSSTSILTVTAGVQPAATLVPAGAGGVPFLTFTLTAGNADVTVNSVTVERTGPGEDGAFSDIGLNDQSGNAIGNTESFNSDHLVVFNQAFTVPANTSKTFTVTGDMAGDLSDFDGEMPALQVADVNASVPIKGSFPIKGTPQTLNNSLLIGSAEASLSPFDPNGATNRYINDKNLIFSGIRVTANSQEDLTLSSITWDQTGTAGAVDIANIAAVVNGISYPTTVDGSSYTSTFSPGIVISKGQTIDVYVQGDLTTTGANRTVEFDIDDSSDIALTGNSYGFGVSVSPESDTAISGNSAFLTSDGTPGRDEGSSFFAGSVVTINPGTLISVGNGQ